MSGGGEVIPDSRKPIVGIIYSDGDSNSAESRSLAFYLASSLASTGYAKVDLIGLRTDGAPSNLEFQHSGLHKGSISFLPPGKSSVADVKTVPVSVNNGIDPTGCSLGTSHVRFSHWSELQNCQMVLVTVNSDDSDACCAKLAAVLPSSENRVVVFGLQRGVKNGGILKDGLKSVVTSAPKGKSKATSSSDIAVVEGLVGFACVPVPFLLQAKHKEPKVAAPAACYYASTITSPKMMMERLNKEISTVAHGPVNLLETLGIEVQFRKTLTPYAWGVLLYENLYALNSVTGGDLLSTIKCRRYRLLLALQIRESRETLLKAARGGKWAPDINLVAPHITPWMFEMALVMPLPFIFFRMFWFSINFLGGVIAPWGNMCSTGVRSPGQCDLIAGNRTMANLHLAEIVMAGERHKVQTPICLAVLNTIRTLEKSASTSSVGGADSCFIREETYSNVNEVKGRMAAIDCAYTALTGNVWYKHPSLWEVSYRCAQIGAILSLFVMFLVIIYEASE